MSLFDLYNDLQLPKTLLLAYAILNEIYLEHIYNYLSISLTMELSIQT